MTTPGGVPNLPMGALTLETLATKLQDMTPPAMRSRAAERLPSTFDSSSGGSALNDLSLFGIMTQLWAGFNSHVALADPADIQGPEDLPELLLDFIESIPVIGQFVELGEAIAGTYEGDDPILLAIQEIWKPLRQLLQLVAGEDVTDFPPTIEQITDGWENLWTALIESLNDNTGIDLSSWDNYLASLEDGKGIDLPGFGTSIGVLEGYFGSILTAFSLGSVSSWITDLLGTKSTASTASSNASSGLSSLQTLFNNIFDGSSGTTGSSGKTLANVLTALQSQFTSLGSASSTASTASSNASTALSNFSSLISGVLGGGHTLSDLITDLLGTKGIAATSTSELDEIKDTFDGLALTPTNPTATVIKSWWDTFFNGGPRNVVEQAQVAANSGVSPLDADERVPWTNLPPELMGTGLGVSYVRLELPSNQSITTATETQLTSLTQTGPATVTFSGSDFKLPYNGFWDLEVVSIWGTSSTNIRECAVKRNGSLVKADGTTAASFVQYPPRNNVGVRVEATTTDTFGVYVYQNSGGSLNCLSAGTYILATFVGTTTSPVSITFDHVGGGNHGGGTSLSWSHVFGAASNTIVVSVSKVTIGAPTVTCGGYSVPIVSGPTYVGNFAGVAAYHTLCAAILPTGVRSTTQTVTVAHGSSQAASSANSQSFNTVGALGAPKVSSGFGSPGLVIPANATSMVAVAYAAGTTNFSSISGTNDYQKSYSAFSTWAHLMVHGVGGTTFTATNSGDWTAKGIELHS